ncbi:MAG: DUF4910 domain-containing protein [bacterium]
MHDLLKELLPLNRSLTGQGVRDTLERLGREVPLRVREVPSGTRVLDWEVPREWSVEEAYLVGPDGRRFADFAESNLHLVGYSRPVRERMPLERLQEHLHSLPEHPEWIPYRTSYWTEDWGFCLAHRERENLPEGEYEVVIESRLEPGHLTYGEIHLPGETDDEILLSAHVCHPSMANDNLSGVLVAVEAARVLADVSRRRTVRVLLAPATIGPVAWMARNPVAVGRIRAGLVLACLGDPGPFTYKQSRRGDAPIDRAARQVLHRRDEPHQVREFTPTGYDERQYGSPGFDLPVSRLTRTPHGEFPEYHTSADDAGLVRPESLEASVAAVLEIVHVLDRDRTLVNLSPYGEPQLGRRGLYRAMGGEPDVPALQEALLWVLNLADGRHGLLDMAERSAMPFELLDRAGRLLEEHELVRDADRPG